MYYNNKNQMPKSKSNSFWTIVGAIITANVISIIIGFIIFAMFAGAILGQINQ